jgi:hypothetical protein
MRSPIESPIGAAQAPESFALEFYKIIVVVLSGVLPTVALGEFLGFGTPISAVATTLLLPAMLALGIKLTGSVRSESPMSTPAAPSVEGRDQPLWDRELDG